MRVLIESFNHETFAAILDRLVEELLNSLGRVRIDVLGVHEFGVDFREVFLKLFASFAKRLVDQCFTVQVDQIECEYAHLHFDVFACCVLKMIKWNKLLTIYLEF